MQHFLNPETLINTVGYMGIFLIIFIESGIFFGFFLPGDSLLFSAGFLASQGRLDIATLIMGVFVASVLGVIIGYLFGKRIGEKIFHKEDSFFFNSKNLKRTQEFYKKYGTLTITLSRFVPIVRTFAPILGGVGKMNFKTLLKYDLLGSALWAVLVPSAGFFFGRKIPVIHELVLPIVTVLFFLTFIPVIIALYKHFRHSARVRKERKNNK